MTPRDPQQDADPWPFDDAGPGPSAIGQVPWKRRLTSRGARRWFFGAAIASAAAVAGNAHGLLAEGLPPWQQAAVVLHLLAFLAVFALIPPLSWGYSERAKLAALALLTALSIPFLLRNGVDGAWMWAFVAVAAGMQMLRRGPIIVVLCSLSGASLALQIVSGAPLSDGLAQPVLIAAMGMMMAAFSQQIAAVRALRDAQHELAVLAVREERSRVARDMHDILGHSLTVMAVKAELAGRLIEIDPARAAVEIASLEDLARGALADVRATVSGYRDVNIGAELAQARAALLAAGIDAQLPGTADMVPAPARDLFGWVLREGVTNVVRHSGASRCVVDLAADHIQIDDDGAGPRAANPPDAVGESGGTGLSGDDGRAGDVGRAGDEQGTGLTGLQDRVDAAGGTMLIGRSQLGGFRLRVQL